VSQRSVTLVDQLVAVGLALASTITGLKATKSSNIYALLIVPYSGTRDCCCKLRSLAFCVVQNSDQQQQSTTTLYTTFDGLSYTVENNN
jgi:predicted phosphoribosyltransferase